MKCTMVLCVFALACACETAPKGKSEPSKTSATEKSESPKNAAKEASSGEASNLDLEFEGLTLLTSLDDLVERCTARGWRHNAQPNATADQRVIVFTDKEHPVKRFKLTYESGILVGVTAEYRVPDPSRHALRERYPRKRHDGEGWVMSDGNKEILVQIDDAGARLQVLHTASMRNRQEVEALYRTFLPDE